MERNKLWGGRFIESTNIALEELNSSINLDKRMYAEDIEGSKAYAKILNSCGLLSDEETNLICGGLDTIKLEWDRKEFIIVDGDEDIHTANERRLKELIGEPAAKLHVGRSRNDQVVTDMKLWLQSALHDLEDLLIDLVRVILTRSTSEIEIIMPGYTHLQRAQPVRWSHWLLSHAFNFKSDADKLLEIHKSVKVMPLGSGALAGNPFPIDRRLLAANLGFDCVTQNSMQAVGDRDFVVEFLFWCTLTGIHLSRLAEDLIIFSSKEFDFVRVSDTFSTGSSLMPQKRNADSLELIRGAAGHFFGHCSNLMMTLKGLPSTYNKDLQSDKEGMFSAYDRLLSILRVSIGTVSTLKVNGDKCRDALNFDMLATDLAYYLVRKRVPFRAAHHDAGRIVSEAERRGISISDINLADLQLINENFAKDVSEICSYENSVEQYQVIGGTSRKSVLEQIGVLEEWLLTNINRRKL